MWVILLKLRPPCAKKRSGRQYLDFSPKNWRLIANLCNKLLRDPTIEANVLGEHIQLSVPAFLPPALSAPALQVCRTMSSDVIPLPHAAPFAQAAISPRGLDLRCAYLAAMTTGRLQSKHSREPSAKSLESLLQRASDLLIDMSAQDPRSRLLQTALLRRDHALLGAVVRAVEDAPFESSFKSVWSPKRLQKPRVVLKLRASERPTYRPPRRVAAE